MKPMSSAVIMALLWLASANGRAATNSAGLIEIASADFGDTNCLMKIVELERNAKTSKLRLTYQQMGSSVGSSMFIMSGFYAVAKARGTEYFTNLKEWDDPDGGRLYIGGFTDNKDADIRQEFGPDYTPANEYGQKRELLSVSQFKIIFEPETDRGAAPACMNAPAPRQPAYERAIQRLQAATNDIERMLSLGKAAKESFNRGFYDEARQYALELRELAPKLARNVNSGQAVQDFNLVLGRLALKDGQMEQAKAHLLAAGHSSGSPVMGSFGPNMSLAKDLLEKGETETVLQYFDLCRAFWKSHPEKLDRWAAEVKAGSIPDFGANLVY